MGGAVMASAVAGGTGTIEVDRLTKRDLWTGGLATGKLHRP
jgi:hypothetical protein